MTNEKLFQHYEKIYFYELARKEQIFSRLSIPLATIIAIAGFYSVIITGDRTALTLGAKIWFLTIIAASIIILGIGIYFFIDALLGKVDENLPAPNTIEKYRLDLISYYSDEEDADTKVTHQLKKYYYENFMNCATICTINNDRKSSSLYYCNVFLILAAGIAVIAYAVITIPKL
ncbi:hypothetical protein HX797_02545 [Pseudomonas edaphica]|uniref:SLATT domain-containing protein n=1 Tax=Pseudomonas edaphica TaxID=2006980 RepID=A0A7Y7V4T7_9PSED|nr:hypothetical protein [Pseudomonas edaphica]NVZ55126.1 hypothetical protein [Pseudomonas edaphica]